MTLVCAACRMSPAHAKGRCEPCYRYWMRTGRERPTDLAERRARQRAETWGIVDLIRGMTSA